MKEFYVRYLLKNAWFQIFAFTSLGVVIKAIDRGGAAKIKHKDTTVEITPKDKGED